jgi:hypothetical protein
MMQRWNAHLNNANSKRGKGCAHFWAAIRKYGKDAFIHRVLAYCDDLETANFAEECWIEYYDSTDPEKGFNHARGGSHKPNPSPKNPWDRPEYRAAMKAALATPESKAKRSALFAVVMKKPEMVAKVSKNAKRTMNDPEVRVRHNAAVRKAWPRKTHCKRGHAYADSGLRKDGSQFCQACRTLREQRPVQRVLKTHCKYGHSLADANIRYPNGRLQRNCRTCQKIRNLQRRDAKRHTPDASSRDNDHILVQSHEHVV